MHLGNLLFCHTGRYLSSFGEIVIHTILVWNDSLVAICNSFIIINRYSQTEEDEKSIGSCNDTSLGHFVSMRDIYSTMTTSRAVSQVGVKQ